MRPGSAHQQERNRRKRGQENSLQDTQKQHSDQRNHCSLKIKRADPPHSQKRREVDKSRHRRQDHGREDGLGKVFQQAGKKQQAECKRGCKHKGGVRAPALSFTAD